MKPIDLLRWTRQEGRLLSRLATFARDQSRADGVIVIFIKGGSAQLAHAVPPALLGEMPQILYSAAHDSVRQLTALAEGIDATASGELRKQIDEIIRKWESKPN